MKQMKHVLSLLLAVALIVSAVPVLGLRVNAANEAVVEIAAASGSMDLTELGNADWMHFTGKETGPQIDRKGIYGGSTAKAEKIEFYDLSDQNGRTFGQSKDQCARYQTFVPEVSGKLSSVEVAVIKKGAVSDLVAKLYKMGETKEELATVTVPASDITDNELLALNFGSDIALEAGTTYAVVLTQATLGQEEYRWCKSTTSFASGKIKEDGSWVQENTAASLRVIVGDPADIVEPTPVNILSFELVGAMTMDTTMSDSAATYSWTDGMPTKAASNLRTGGVLNYKQGDESTVGTIPEEAGWKLSVPASADVQTLTFVSGVWNSSCEIYIYANGDTSKPVYSNAELNAGKTSKLLTYTVTIAPNTSIEVYGKMAAKAHSYGNMSLCAATLNRSETQTQPAVVEIAAASGSMNLTELGNADWMHFTGKKTGPQIDRKGIYGGSTAKAEKIEFYDLSDQNGRTFGQSKDQCARYQTFVPEVSGKLSSVEVAVIKKGAVSDLVAKLYKMGETKEELATVTVPASDITDNELLALNFGSDIALEAGTTYAVVLTQATLGQEEYRWCKSTTSFASGKIKEDGSWVQENTAASLRVIVGDPADIVEPTPVNILSFELVGAMTMDTTMSDSAATYSWTDGMPTKAASNLRTGGVLNYKQGDESTVGTIPEEAGWKLSVPASADVQTLTFVSGVWNSSCEIYIYANGDTSKPVYSNAELNAGKTSKLLTYTVTVAPYTSIEVYGKMTAKAYRDGNMSLCAATLSRSDSGEEDYIAKLREAVEEAQTLLDEFGDEIGAFQRQQLEEALAAAKTALNNEHLTQSEAYLQYLLLKGAISAAEASDTDKSYANKYASGIVCSFGWEGDKDAPILWVDGTYQLRDNGNKLITFGVDELAPKSAKWYNAEGYLPCFVSEYAKDGLQHKIETFADEVYVNGNRYEIAYSRMTTTNTTDKIQRLPRVSRDLVALNTDAAARTVEPGQTVVREYCVGADRFGGTYAYPENEVLAAQGSWAEHYEHMKNYWNKRLETLVKIESVPEEYADLIDAYKAGYIYTLIISDGYELHVGENGYDRVYDHDVIGMLATLIESGHTEHFADYAQFILQNIQYPDAAWKFSWPFALYLQKTGDYDTVLSFFENQGGKDGIKSNTHKIASERTVYDTNIKDANGKDARIMKITNAIDSKGYWTIDNWAALFGLTTYSYLCDELAAHASNDTDKAYYKAEYDWAQAEYADLLLSVEAVLKNTMEKYDFDYIPISMVTPNEQSKRKDPRDGNWAAHYLFGRWNWDGYLFGADQSSWLLGMTDKTYDYIIDQKSSVLPSPYTMGGYPGYSSAYNAGYYSAALSGEKWRDGGIKAYQWMINNAQSSPFGWWEGIHDPSTTSPWEQQSCTGTGSSQHMWGQSTATKILIDSFLAEKADGTIIAGRGLPAEWNADGQEIKISDWLCNGGKRIGFTMKSTAEYIDFTLTGDELANDVSLELIALKGNIKSASGCEFDAEAGTVLIPAGTRRVRVYLGQAVPVTGVELDKTELELTVNDTAKLTATVTPANADNAKVSWTSSDETVAIVDKNGNVTAVGAGTATVTVTTEDGGFTATCTVTVKAKAVPVDKSALEALYKELKDTANDGYTDETWNAFQKALTEAKQTLDNEDAKQGEVDAAAKALRNAAAALAKPEVKPADKTALAELVKKAEALKPADYTKKSFRAVETTLKTAKALLADETLTEVDQQKIDTAADALQKAMEGLVKADTKTPATGDSFDPVFWTGMMLLALGAAACVTLASKKSKKH